MPPEADPEEKISTEDCQLKTGAPMSFLSATLVFCFAMPRLETSTLVVISSNWYLVFAKRTVSLLTWSQDLVFLEDCSLEGVVTYYFPAEGTHTRSSRSHPKHVFE